MPSVVRDKETITLKKRKERLISQCVLNVRKSINTENTVLKLRYVVTFGNNLLVPIYLKESKRELQL